MKPLVLILFLAIVILGIFLFNLPPKQNQTQESTMKNPNESFQVKSTAFKDNGTIPEKYTCDGEDVNPFLEIKNPPEETKSFALVVDDPDAPGGVWDHWVVWNISPKTQYISEDSVPSDVVQGKNSFGKRKYRGPCPPFGHDAHHYRFTVYALDTVLNIPENSGSDVLMSAMGSHILAQTRLTGMYKRKE